jgi:hypothetical protein
MDMDLIAITASADQIQTASLIVSIVLTGIFYKRYKKLNTQLHSNELLEKFLKD